MALFLVDSYSIARPFVLAIHAHFSQGRHRSKKRTCNIKRKIFWHHSVPVMMEYPTVQGLYSLSGKTSYHHFPRSLEAARLDLIMIVSLRNLTGISAALLPRRLSNFKAIGKVLTRISRLRDFTRSCDKTSYRLVHRVPGRDPSLRHDYGCGWLLESGARGF